MFMLVGFSASANEHEARMHEANEYLKTAQYDKAIEIYDQILNADYFSPELYYNLGICHYNKKELGRAVLNFKRALKYDPSFVNAQVNIETIKSEQANSIYEVETFFLSKLWTDLSHFMPASLWAILSLLLLLGIAFLVYLFLFKTNVYPVQTIKTGIATIGFLFLISFLAANKRANSLGSDQHAIVLEESKRYAGPDEKSVVEEDLIPEGTEVIILEELSGWYKVSLPDLDHVWMTPDMFEGI
jgi:tetratricopeptide (TPR) repeat protein